MNIFKQSKLFAFLIIFVNISSLFAYQPPAITILRIADEPSQSLDENLKKLFNDDGNLSYDAVSVFLEDLEEERIIISSEEDLDKITQFLAYLSKQGAMPDLTAEKQVEMEKDIQELLIFFNDSDPISNLSYKTNDYRFIPCIYYGQGEILLCKKNWLKKQCHHIAKFIKKHKKAVIIGTVLVVAAVAVVATVAIASSTAAASAAATAAADSHDKSKEKKEATGSSESKLSDTSDIILNDAVQESLDSQVTNYKKLMSENNFSISTLEEPNSFDSNRIVGATLAHDALYNLPNNLSSNEKLVFKGHEKVDNAFSTNQALFYVGKQKENLQESIFYFQGQEALKTKNYDQAIDNFGKAIEINPNNHEIYLDKAYAYLESGNFEKSLSDYKTYNEQESKKTGTFSNCIDFTMGAAIGLPKGAVESGKELATFAGNLASHPVNTSREMMKAISTLVELAHSQEWDILKQALAPEICELVDNWDVLPPKERGEKTGYLVGKYGADILIPGAATKIISQGIKGAKELALVAKSLENTEKVVLLESLETGGKSSPVTETFYANRIIEEAEEAESLINRTPNLAQKIIQINNNDLNSIRSVNGLEFSDHAVKRMAERNISEEMIKNGIQNGKLYFDPLNDSYILILKNGYYGNDLIIARGANSKKIVTVFPSDKKISKRYVEVQKEE